MVDPRSGSRCPSESDTIVQCQGVLSADPAQLAISTVSQASFDHKYFDKFKAGHSVIALVAAL